MNFILSEFNEEKIVATIDYIKQTYKMSYIIYGSIEFCEAMVRSLLPIEQNDDDKADASIGLIGRYYWAKVYCVPELPGTTGIIMPEFEREF